MNKKVITSVLVVGLIGIVIYGFNQSETTTIYSTNTCNKVEFNNQQFDKMVNHLYPSKYKENLSFSIEGYKEEREFQIDISKNFPNSWIRDVEEKRTSSWARNYEQAILMERVMRSETVGDLIEKYPIEWLKSYEYVSVSIKTHFKDVYYSYMSESEVISGDQHKILNRVEVNDKIEIVINYKKANYVTGKEEYDRMNVILTVIPENEAVFSFGYDSLINYFNANNATFIENLKVEQYIFLSVKFKIDEKGFPEDIKLDRNSGIKGLDEHITELLSNMPAWTPASDAKGNFLKQQFTLRFGAPGC